MKLQGVFAFNHFMISTNLKRELRFDHLIKTNVFKKLLFRRHVETLSRIFISFGSTSCIFVLTTSYISQNQTS